VRFFSHVRRPLKLCLVGAPGVGKGTFAAILGPHYGIPAISSGDLVRNEIKLGTKLGKEIDQLNRQGLLVGDQIVFEMVRKRLSEGDTKNGFLLDGFPRKVSQAELLQSIHTLDVVCNISLEEDMLVLKATSRRVCPKCGANYNIANIQRGEISMPPLLPKISGLCDKCGLSLIQRDDDTEEIVRHRLNVYNKNTFPLIDYYKKKNLLVTFEVKRGKADAPRLIETLDSWRNRDKTL